MNQLKHFRFFFGLWNIVHAQQLFDQLNIKNLSTASIGAKFKKYPLETQFHKRQDSAISWYQLERNQQQPTKHQWNPTKIAKRADIFPNDVYGTAAIKRRGIIDDDQRFRVNVTDIPAVFPWQKLGWIASSCTGSLISPRHILTAAHCVVGRNHDWFASYDFYQKRPEQLKVGSWKTAYVPAEWVEDGISNSDFAIIELYRDFSADSKTRGWLSMKPAPATGTQESIVLLGFPDDKPRFELWVSLGTLKQAGQFLALHNADTMPGTSGAPIMIKQNGEFQVQHVHNGHSAGVRIENFATSLTRERIQLICHWINNSNIC